MSDDLDRLTRDLMLEAETIGPESRAVVAKGALNIKKDWRQRASGIDHAPRYPQSIGYDMKGNAFFSRAEIGPEDGTGDNNHQGFLGEVLEFGGAHNGPRNDGGQALDTEAPKFEKAIQDLAGKHL